jgi:dicarboxylate/amino acid:cation (Na+ or H+) symporter, DAACS family
MKLHHWLLISLVLGAGLGLALQPYNEAVWILSLRKSLLDPLGQVFLRLIFMVVVPMVFCGLFLGVFELASHHDLGSVIRRTLLLTVVTSGTSVLLGVGMVNLFKPGAGRTGELALNAGAFSSTLEKNRISSGGHGVERGRTH